MVILRTTGNIETHKAKLNEGQLSTIRQAEYHYRKSLELMDDVIFSKEFRTNNGPSIWTDAFTAVSEFIHQDDNKLKKEIIYEENKQ